MGDPYEDLGVPYGSDPETVKAAFARFSRRLTPERRAADPEAAAAYAKIAAAYAELANRKTHLDMFESWGKGGPDPQAPPPAAAVPEPAAAAAPVESGPEAKPSEEYTFHRFKGRFCLAAGAVMAVRGAIGVYLDPGGLLHRLARHVPWTGELDRDGAFIVMLMGLGTAAWGAGSFLISDREAREMARRRRYRIGRRGFF